MNKYYILLFFLAFMPTHGMEKRKAPEQPVEPIDTKKARLETAAQEYFPFEQLPNDVKNYIFSFLATAPGHTNAERLRVAAANIRSFMMLNKTFKRRYLDCEKTNYYCIKKLTERYAANPVDAAVALHTTACRKLLQEGGKTRPKIRQWAALLFFAALEKGDVTAVSFLLNVAPSLINCRDRENNNPLMIATKNGNLLLVKRLLKEPGININALNRNNHSALSLALEHNYPEIAQCLLSTPGITVNKRNGRVEYPLLVAAKKGYVTVVESLLTIPDPHIDLNVCDEDGNNALLLATKNNHQAVIRLLASSSRINCNYENKRGERALLLAVRKNNLESVNNILVSSTVEVNISNSLGKRPLPTAVGMAHLPIVRRLLQVNGINLNIRDINGRNEALTSAQNSRYTNKNEIIQLLKDHGAVS